MIRNDGMGKKRSTAVTSVLTRGAAVHVLLDFIIDKLFTTKLVMTSLGGELSMHI